MKKLLFVFISFQYFAQSEKPGEVISKIPIGSQYYYYLKENGTENYYKSSVTNNVELIYGQNVQLRFVSRPDSLIEVFDPNSPTIILAKLIKNTNNVNDPNAVLANLKLRLPTVKDSILYFQSKKHFDEVYDLTNSYLTTQRNGKKSNKLLKKIEKQFDQYVSFNEAYELKYALEDSSFTEKEIETIEAEDFINNEILKIYLNNHRFVGIGDSLYYYHNRELIISTHNSNYSKIIKLFKEVSRLETLSGYDAFNPHSELGQNRDVVYQSKAKSKTHGTAAKQLVEFPDVRYRTALIIDFYPESCNPYKKGLAVSLFKEIDPDASGGWQTVSGWKIGTYPAPTASLVVDWGDGTSSTYSNYIEETVYHTYATAGEFLPITTLNFYTLSMQDGRNIPGGIDIYFNTTDACTHQDRSTDGTLTSGNLKLYAELYVNHNIFGNHIGSKTHAWKYQSGGWRRKVANITCSVNGAFRSDQCVVVETKTGSDSERQERVDVQVNKYHRDYKNAGNQGISSHHTLSLGETNIVLDLTLTPCP